MYRTALRSFKKLTDEEIGSAISFINQVGSLSDEALQKRDLKIGEPQLLNHFLSAVQNRQSTLLPEQAVTLLRLTPVLLPKGSHTVHTVVLVAAPKVKELFEKATTLSEKRRFAEAMKTAGLVCMSPRLGPTSREARLKEFDLFESFIGDTPAYKNARTKYDVRHKVQVLSPRFLPREPVEAVPRASFYPQNRLFQRED